MTAVSRPRISVVTIALNAAVDLPLTLESIVAQDYPELERVVVDGASWDNSHHVLDRYRGSIETIVSRPDAGIYYAMNAILDSLQGEYVIFMNAGDQFYSDNAVSRMVSAIELADIFYGDHIYVHDRIESLRRSAPIEVIADRLRTGAVDGAWLNAIPGHQATFARVDLLRKLRFDTRLRISADHDLLFRAYAAGARLQYVDEIVCHYHGGGFSMLMGERTTLEGASIYRSFSDHPEKVDRLFFSHSSPFAGESRASGVKRGGFYPADISPAIGSLGDAHWIAGEGCELLSPDRETMALDLQGHNRIEGQAIDLFLGDVPLAAAEIGCGPFALALALDPVVPANSIVRLVPRRSELVGDRRAARVGMALQRFRFCDVEEFEGRRIRPGQRIDFTQSNRTEVLPLLGSGWADLEQDHIWGVGAASNLLLNLSHAVARLRILIGGNPHVPGGRQRIGISVNGVTIASAITADGEDALIDLSCSGAPWVKNGSNHLTMTPDIVAVPPPEYQDTRVLSVRLIRLETLAA